MYDAAAGRIRPTSQLGNGVLLAPFSPVLQAPLGAVHFCSTDVSPAFTGYMEGAVRHGRATAERVARLLRQEEEEEDAAGSSKFVWVPPGPRKWWEKVTLPLVMAVAAAVVAWLVM